MNIKQIILIGIFFLILSMILNINFNRILAPKIYYSNKKIQKIYDDMFLLHTKKCMEYAYFEGQRDYKNNDIRIDDKGYIKSCWDDTNMDWKSEPMGIFIKIVD